MKFTIYDTDGVKLEKLYQWDTNRVIRVATDNVVESADSDSIYFHFSNVRTTEAYVVKPTREGDRSYYGDIPNELLTTDDVVSLYLFRAGDESGNLTIGEAKIPVTARAMPSDYGYNSNFGTIVVANGLKIVDGILYLAKDGVPFGTGTELN